MMKAIKLLLAATLIGAVTSVVARAQSDNYPNRPITVIMPFAGGSTSDVITRILLDRMSRIMG